MKPSVQPVSANSAEVRLAGLSHAQHGPPAGVHLHDKSVSPRGGPWWARDKPAFSAPRAFKVCTEDLMQVKLACTASCKQRPAWTAKLQRRARHLAVTHLGQDRTHQDQTLRQSLGVHVCAGSTCITLLTMSSQRSYDSRHWIKRMFFPSTIYSSAHHILGPFSHSYRVSGITWPADSGAVPIQECAKVLGSAAPGR